MNESSIVISSRVRLARNLAEIPFPQRMSEAQAREVISRVRDALGADFTCLATDTMPPLEKQALTEQHLISPMLREETRPAAVLLNADRSVSVMVNEEDHLRIQSIIDGFDLRRAYRLADETDDRLEATLSPAFDREIGYLTACPTNVGTGMRASVMLHLPALSAQRRINGLIASVGKMGFAVRGLYGEGSSALGDLYQISNQVTLGISEEETLTRLTSITEQIIERETQLRATLAEQQRAQLCDSVWRALGTLKYAQLLSTEEFMSLSSKLRLGISMGMITHIGAEHLNRLTTAIQPANLQKLCGRALKEAERDFERANYIRKHLEPGKDD